MVDDAVAPGSLSDLGRSLFLTPLYHRDAGSLQLCKHAAEKPELATF